MSIYQKLLVLVLLAGLVIAVVFGQDIAGAKAALQKKAYDEVISILLPSWKSNNRNAETNYLLGEAYWGKKDLDSAQMLLERAVDLNDEYVDAYAVLFHVYGKKGIWDKAQKKYNEAVKNVGKKNTKIPLSLAKAYLENDSLTKAQFYFTVTKEINDKLIDVYLGLAEAYGRENIHFSAIENYKRAIELDTTSPTIRYLLGKAYYRNRQYNEAAQEFQEAIRLDPKNEAVILELADLYYRAKLWKEASIFFAKYVELIPDNHPINVQYGKALYWGRFYKDAVPVLEKALKQNGTLYELKPMFAHVLYETGEPIKSLEVYKTLPPDSLHFDELIRMGRAYVKQKDTTNAIASFEKANALDTSSIEISLELGLLYSGRKQFDLATMQYDRKLRNDPNNVVALYYGGIAFNMIGKTDTAKGLFTRYVNLRPIDLTGRVQLARAYQLQDSLDIAREKYQQILTIIDSLLAADSSQAIKDKYVPTIIAVHYILAQMDYKQKEFLSAVSNMEKAISFESKDIKKKDDNLHLFLAQMYNVARSVKTLDPVVAREIRQKAVAEYRFVLKINPKNATAKKELGQLEGN